MGEVAVVCDVICLSIEPKCVGGGIDEICTIDQVGQCKILIYSLSFANNRLVSAFIHSRY